MLFPDEMKTSMKTTKSILFGILTITTALAVQVRAQSYLTKGLVAYYPLSGDALDASGHGNDGTPVGVAFVANPHGVTNGCCQFYGNWPDNDNSYINVTTTSSLNFTNGATIACWCVVDGSGYESPRLVCFGNSILSGPNAGNLEITFRPGSPQQFVFAYGTNLNNATMATWAASFTNGQWLHLVGVGTATSEQLYVNGILVSNVTGLVSSDIGQATVMNIGRDVSNGGGPGYDDFDGRMDEVRIYNRALSATEVQQLYDYEYAFQFEPSISLLKAVKPSFNYLLPGTNYQLQVSSDLNTWTTNSTFTATNTSMTYTQYFDVDNWNTLFFRLQVAP
jgi:hypothetical protein